MRRLIIYILLLYAGNVLGQQKNYSFTRYTTAQGLSDNIIQSITQDSRGFIWIGTNEGLSRFDGKNFKNFYAPKNDTIVKSNSFSNIYEYKKGHLLFTNYTRIVCFNTYTEKFYSPALPDKPFAWIDKSPKENIFYLSALSKVYIANERLVITDSITLSGKATTGNQLNAFYLTDSLLLLQAYDTVAIYNTITKKSTPLSIAFNLPDKSFIPFFRYYDSAKQQLYFSEYRLGIFRYSLQEKKTEHLVKDANGLYYTNSFVYEIVPKPNNELWLLAESGIRILNTHTNTISFITAAKDNNSSVFNSVAFTSYTDKANNFWIGTKGGIYKLNANALSIKSWTDEFITSDGNGLMSVVKGADDNMYASVYFGKAYQLNTNTGKVNALQHPGNINNWDLFVKDDEVIRTGAGNSLLTYNTSNRQFKTDNSLKKFYPDIELLVLGFVHSNGDVWYSANRGGGFVRKLAGSDTYKTYKKDDGVNSFTNGYYTSCTEDSKKNLWFGVNKTDRLLHWDHLKDRFNEINFFTIKGTENVGHLGINMVTHDSADNIWVAFDGSGLIKYDPVKNTAVNYNIADGLPSNFVTGLQFDNKNRLWISTLKGLSCFIVNENKFINFKKEDGLPADDFTDHCSYYDKEKNILWFGSNNTLMEFDPDVLLDISKEKFPVYTDEIILNGKKYDDTLQNNLMLDPSENNLQFHFTGIDFNKGKDIEYSYLLQGADKDWIFSGVNQTASYANIKPGNYTFRVRAKHKGDNRWNETEQPLHFFIATPWNKTWWFNLLLIAVLALAVWYLIKTYYTQKLEKEKSELEKQNAIEQERIRMARELHDGLGSMLSGIKHSFSAMKNEMTLNDNQQTQFHSTIDKLNESIKELRNISHSIASENLMYNGLENSLRDYCNSMTQPGVLNIAFSALDTEKIQLTEEQAFHIFRIVQELINNIIKHSGAANAIVQLSYNSNRLYVTVEDNGKGFVLEEGLKNKGMGLKNIESRIKILKGKMDYRTKTNEGTSALMEFPYAEKK
ncbi:two-component regulator propeller domain-containing protein [Ferruginibacter sp. SUN106]|uniref:sensor histidine kinase n=1 Tax=Ferruginibacter sp. SUN106 TaxID=2978348 RepID=UPI003D362FD3